jgi:excisionase family DNA binding protein
MIRLLTAKQVADLLQVTLARVYELSREDILPVVRIGRQVRFDEEKLRDWITSGGYVQRSDYNNNGSELTK